MLKFHERLACRKVIQSQRIVHKGRLESDLFFSVNAELPGLHQELVGVTLRAPSAVDLAHLPSAGRVQDVEGTTVVVVAAHSGTGADVGDGDLSHGEAGQATSQQQAPVAE